MRNRIKELREARGLSQAELARRLGTSPPSVSRYEAEDGRVTMPLLQKIAAALGCDPCALISDDSFSELVKVPVRHSDDWILLDPRMHKAVGLSAKIEMIEASDDSMAPTAARGDMCLIDVTHRHVQGDGLYAFAADGQTYIKRATHNPLRQTISITSDNPIYPPMGEAASSEVDVIGKVVGMVKAM